MFRHWIRDATSEIHQALHHHPVLAPLTWVDVTLEDYLHALTGLHGFFAPMERCLSNTPDVAFRSSRSALLEADIRAIAGNDAERFLSQTPASIPAWTDPDRPLGAFYVMDGASHGARSMVGNLRSRLGLGEAETSYMGSVGFDAVGEWRQLMQLMAERAADETAAERMVDGAISTFSAIERWLDEFHRSGGRRAA